MSGLLIHSMAEFADIILPTLKRASVRRVAEIGSEFGGMSRVLADYCVQADGHLTCIDPEPQPAFVEWAEEEGRVTHLASPSLDAIETCRDIDAWFVDGDHNYYTVSRELAAIDAAAQRDGRPLLVFLHDVSWPCARRDMYYAPHRIPAQFCHPHSFKHGVTLGCSDAVEGRGFRGAGQFAVALASGGPANGVLTAVEDFLAAADRDERPLCWVNVPAVFGLGIIFDANVGWAGDCAELLLPYHDNALLARLEENRLRNYLAVLDWQDRSIPADELQPEMSG
jgi:hypothetical protein